jgi:hypothetical protein
MRETIPRDAPCVHFNLSNGAIGNSRALVRIKEVSVEDPHGITQW